MSNPLFQVFGGWQNNQFAQLVQQFQQFRNTFRGDPQQEVQKLLQSGKISQQQLNQLQNAAQQFQALLR
jgi:hypothetical protein